MSLEQRRGDPDDAQQRQHEGDPARVVSNSPKGNQLRVVHKPKSSLDLDWMPAEMRPLVEQVTEPQRVAATLWAEARSEPVQGIVAVANVIKHRYQAPGWWGSNPSEVVTKAHQFSCWTPAGGQRNYDKLIWLMQQFASGTPITDPGVRECIGIAHLLLGDYLRDNVKGSTHYHTVNLNPRPAWAKGVVPTCQVGGHVFYAGIK